jgi:hypothetical protein
VITTTPDDALSEALIALHRRKHALVLILVTPTAEAITPRLASIPVLRAQYDRDWMNREALVLAR